MLAPIFQKYAIKYQNEKLKFLKVDINVCAEIALEADISTVPACLVIKDRKIVEKLLSTHESDVLELITKYL